MKLALLLIAVTLVACGATYAVEEALRPEFGAGTGLLFMLPLYATPLLGAVYVGLFSFLRWWGARTTQPTDAPLIAVGLRGLPWVAYPALGALLLPLAVPPIRRQKNIRRFVLMATSFWAIPVTLGVAAYIVDDVSRHIQYRAADRAEREFKTAEATKGEERCAYCRAGSHYLKTAGSSARRSAPAACSVCRDTP